MSNFWYDTFRHESRGKNSTHAVCPAHAKCREIEKFYPKKSSEHLDSSDLKNYLHTTYLAHSQPNLEKSLKVRILGCGELREIT